MSSKQKLYGTMLENFDIELSDNGNIIPFAAIFASKNSIVVPFGRKNFAIYAIAENSFYYIKENFSLRKINICNPEIAKKAVLSKIVDLGIAENFTELTNNVPKYIFNNIYGMHIGSDFYVFSTHFPITKLKI